MVTTEIYMQEIARRESLPLEEVIAWFWEKWLTADRMFYAPTICWASEAYRYATREMIRPA